MIDKMLVTVIAVFLMVVLAMQLMLLSLPFFRRLEFDAICHNYALRMDRAGGMSEHLRSDLVQELVGRGFAVSRATGTSSAPYGGNLDLVVEAGFTFHRFTHNLVLEEVSISVIHQSSTVCRVLKTIAAVP